MKYDCVLAFDMDDTLCNTHKEVHKRVLDYCLNNLYVNEATYLAENPDVHFSDYEGQLKEITLGEVIMKRTYMDTAEPTELFNNLDWLFKNLREKFGKSIKIVICSHRGDNIDAWMSTYNYLKSNGIVDQFDMIHSIDSRINKNKLEYLERMYPESKILLVDDNPFGSKNEIKEFDSRVLIYGEVVQNKCSLNQSLFINHVDLLSSVCSLLD